MKTSCTTVMLSTTPRFIDGRRLRILVVVDDCTRECLALIADTSISGIRVARELDRLLDERGKPKTIVSDNGTELTSRRTCAGSCKAMLAMPHGCGRSKGRAS